MQVQDVHSCILCTVQDRYELSLSAYPPSEGALKSFKLRPLGNVAPPLFRVWSKVKQLMHEVLDVTERMQHDSLEMLPLLCVYAQLQAAHCDAVVDGLHSQVRRCLSLLESCGHP